MRANKQILTLKFKVNVNFAPGSLHKFLRQIEGVKNSSVIVSHGQTFLSTLYIQYARFDFDYISALYRHTFLIIFFLIKPKSRTEMGNFYFIHFCHVAWRCFDYVNEALCDTIQHDFLTLCRGKHFFLLSTGSLLRNSE